MVCFKITLKVVYPYENITRFKLNIYIYFALTLLLLYYYIIKRISSIY